MTISVHDDFFESSLLNDIVKHSTTIPKVRGRMMFSNMTWEQNVVHDSTPVLIHPLPEQESLHGRILAAVQDKLGLKPDSNSILFYYWPTYSYIPWHNDGMYKAGITVYLNKHWSKDDGGLYLYEEHSKIHAIVPKHNLCLVQTGGVLHSTTPVLPRGKLRRTLQMWVL